MTEATDPVEKRGTQTVIPLEGEKGAVLPLFALLLPVILLLIGVGIDLGLASVSLQQTRGYARLLALAAVEEYFRTGQNPALSQEERLSRTLDKVNLIARENRISGNFGGPSLALSFRGGGGEERGGILIPGRYFQSTVPRRYCVDEECGRTCSGPQGQEQCNPCSQGRATHLVPPCFYELSIAEVTAPTPADRKEPFAFRVEARLYGGVVARFSRASAGAIEFPMSSDSIASVTPRQIMFMVDVTGSMERQTYLRRTPFAQANAPGDGRGSKHAFFLTRDNVPNPCDPNSAPSTAIMSDDMQWRFLEDFEPQRFDPRDPHSGYDIPAARCSEPGSAAKGVRRRQSVLPPASMIHFLDDYTVVDVLTDPSALGDFSLDILPDYHPRPSATCLGEGVGEYCAPRERYRVNTCCDDPSCGLGQPWCQGPQPLGVAIEGLHGAVQAIRSRLVPGDKVGLIFFDRDPVWTRIVKPIDDFDYLLRLSAPTPDGAMLRRALKIFPGKEGYTDLRAALSEALLLMEASHAQGLKTQDSIVLLSDGLSNCSRCGGVPLDELRRFDVNGDGRFDLDDQMVVFQCIDDPNEPQCSGRRFTEADREMIIRLLECPQYGCSNSYDAYRLSIAEVLSLAQEIGKPGVQIPVHVLAIGEGSAAHQVDLGDPRDGARCLSEREIRAQRLSPVRGGLRDDSSGIEVSDCNISNASHISLCRTLYGKIGESVSFFEASKNLHAIAQATGGIYAPIFLGPPAHDFIGGLCASQPNAPSCCKPGHVWRTDKHGRSPLIQIQDVMRRIVNEQAPFVVVESL